MTVYIGVDFHPYEQSVAFCDDGDGEIRYKRFVHSDKESIMAFYRRCGRDAIVGVEATGCLWWFEKVMFENGMELKIGDPRMIRRAALSRHKNDFREQAWFTACPASSGPGSSSRPKAKVAAARKLLINCYVMLRDQISYEEFTRRGEAGLCVGSGEVKSNKLQSLEA